jgi:hypothetical protein
MNEQGTKVTKQLIEQKAPSAEVKTEQQLMDIADTLLSLGAEVKGEAATGFDAVWHEGSWQAQHQAEASVVDVFLKKGYELLPVNGNLTMCFQMRKDNIKVGFTKNANVGLYLWAQAD